MKVKTADLTGPVLDWAVAKCIGWDDETIIRRLEPDEEGWCIAYSTDWSQGGPIIEQEGITLLYCEGEYVAGTNPECFDGQVFMYHKQYGLTPLIAAMRCYVASKMGDEVEVPEELQ